MVLYLIRKNFKYLSLIGAEKIPRWTDSSNYRVASLLIKKVFKYISKPYAIGGNLQQLKMCNDLKRCFLKSSLYVKKILLTSSKANTIQYNINLVVNILVPKVLVGLITLGTLTEFLLIALLTYL